MRKSLLDQVYYLVYDCHLPVTQVSKRLQISYPKLLRILKMKITDPEIAFNYRKPRLRFKKLHHWLRDHIHRMISTSTKPVQLNDIHQALIKESKVNISKSMIYRYIRTELNVSYRKLRPVKILYNSIDARL
jgi:hypothetical protein